MQIAGDTTTFGRVQKGDLPPVQDIYLEALVIIGRVKRAPPVQVNVLPVCLYIIIIYHPYVCRFGPTEAHALRENVSRLIVQRLRLGQLTPEYVEFLSRLVCVICSYSPSCLLSLLCSLQLSGPSGMGRCCISVCKCQLF